MSKTGLAHEYFICKALERAILNCFLREVPVIRLLGGLKYLSLGHLFLCPYFQPLMAGDAWENHILISFLLVWYKRTHLDCLLLPQVKRCSLLWTCRSKSSISLIYLQGLAQWGLRKTVPWCFLRSTLNHSRQSHQEQPLLSEKELVIRMGEKGSGGGGWGGWGWLLW